MIIRNTTDSGDFTFGKGIQDYKKNLDAIKQNVKTRLLSWRGDCFFAIEEGVDYNNLLDVGTKDLLDSDIKRVILQTEGVLKISYNSALDRETRNLSVQCEITTIFGKAFLVDEKPKEARDKYITANKTTPDGLLKMTPDGLFKITFVKEI